MSGCHLEEELIGGYFWGGRLIGGYFWGGRLMGGYFWGGSRAREPEHSPSPLPYARTVFLHHVALARLALPSSTHSTHPMLLHHPAFAHLVLPHRANSPLLILLYYAVLGPTRLGCTTHCCLQGA